MMRRTHSDFSVDPEIYFDEERFHREHTFIRNRVWLIACHESEIPAPGSFYVFENMGESIILMRTHPDKIVAMRNSCLHRGSPLLRGKGTCREIICPYHGWRYGRDGRLRGKPGSQELEQIPAKIIGGFIWIHPGPKAPAIDSYLGVTGHYFGNLFPSPLTVAHRETFTLDCNWKNYLENVLDSYHIATVHNSFLSKISKISDLMILKEGRNLALKMPIANYRWRRWLDGETTASDAARYYHKIYLFPNTVVNFTATNATVYNIWPLAPGKTSVEYRFLRLRSVNPLIYLRNTLVLQLSRWINREDNAILPSYYANIRRFPWQRHRFVAAEASLIMLHENLRRYLR